MTESDNLHCFALDDLTALGFLTVLELPDLLG